MINSMQQALIKKDIQTITANKRLFSVLLIVPLVMTLFLPTILILTVTLTPTNDLQPMLDMLPAEMRQGSEDQLLIGLIMNNVIPLFFLLIPVMAASVMAASSFVGEKEKHTLETLLYCPLTLHQIYQAKILASFLLSMIVSALSFLVMLVVVEAESWFLTGSLLLPGINWLILLVLVSPALTTIAITFIVRGSAKAQTVEESQQRSVFLILPVILLAVSQFTGLLLVNGWIMAGLGVLLAIIAVWLMRVSSRGFQYEALLK